MSSSRSLPYGVHAPFRGELESSPSFVRWADFQNARMTTNEYELHKSDRCTNPPTNRLSCNSSVKSMICRTPLDISLFAHQLPCCAKRYARFTEQRASWPVVTIRYSRIRSRDEPSRPARIGSTGTMHIRILPKVNPHVRGIVGVIGLHEIGPERGQMHM